MEGQVSSLQKREDASMRLLTLSPFFTLMNDIGLWLLIHLGFSYGCYKLPLSFLRERSTWFRPFPFEKEGLFYERYLKIKRWKPLLPDGSALFKKGFRKRHLEQSSATFFQTFILETHRAELTHWLCLLPAPLFFFWNDAVSGLIMILYAIAANLPCILVQRYNRIRLVRVTARKKSHKRGLKTHYF